MLLMARQASVQCVLLAAGSRCGLGDGGWSFLQKCDLCFFFHRGIGHKARCCAHVLMRHQEMPRPVLTSSFGAGEQEKLLFLKHFLSGWLPGDTPPSRLSEPQQLTAAHGSSIETSGTRSVFWTDTLPWPPLQCYFVLIIEAVLFCHLSMSDKGTWVIGSCQFLSG